MSDADRILATSHVGSLIRPPELVDFLLKQQDGKAYDTAAFEAVLRETVDNVVRQQAEIGIDIVSDGEYGKPFGWSRYILHRLSGFEERPAPPATSGSLAATAGTEPAGRRKSPTSTGNMKRPTEWSAWESSTAARASGPFPARSDIRGRPRSKATSSTSRPRSPRSSWACRGFHARRRAGERRA